MALIVEIERVLRADHHHPSDAGSCLLRMLAFILIGGAIYGVFMGSFGGFTHDRAWQVLYSAIKVPLLLLVTFGLSLPSFFVLNTLMGLRSDIREAIQSLLAAQASMGLILAALSPYVGFWYASFSDYNGAILFNGFLFAIASIGAQFVLKQHYRRLIERNAKHRWLLLFWLVIHVFIGIQMGWVLRPFVGSPGMEVQFFRQESWGNAYMVVARLISNSFF